MVYGIFSFGEYTSNKQELADYGVINQQFEQANVKFQKLLKAKKDLEKDLSKGQKLKSNSRSSFIMFREIAQAVPKNVVLVNIRTSEQDYNTLVVEGQSIEDRPIIDLIDALNSKETIEKASLVNMKVQTKNGSSTESKYLTLTDIKGIDPCSFKLRINPFTNAGCSSGEYFTNYNPQEVTPYDFSTSIRNLYFISLVIFVCYILTKK